MKTTAKIGGVIELEIRRANGDVDYIGKIHNVVGLASTAVDRVIYNHAGAPYAGAPAFYTRVDKGSTYLQGTLSQSGTTVTRVSGLENLSDISNGDLIEFNSGERAYKTASISASSCTVSKSQTVAATTAKRHKTNTGGWGTFANIGTISTALTLGPQTVTSAYVNGVVTTQIGEPRYFPSAISAYSLACITSGIFISSQSNQYAAYYDLPSPISIAIGDVIIIKSWVYTVTFDSHLPRAFASSVISGLSGSGKYQRLAQPQRNESSAPTVPTVLLISNANKITIPNMPNFTDAYINPSSLTAIEAIPATFFGTASSTSNNNTQISQFIVSTNIGGTVKQIIWGGNTQAYGIIEFDTPVVIPANRALSIVSSLQMEVELP